MTKDQARAKALDIARRINSYDEFRQAIVNDNGTPVIVVGQHRFSIFEFLLHREINNISVTGGNCFIFADQSSCIVKRKNIITGHVSRLRQR